RAGNGRPDRRSRDDERNVQRWLVGQQAVRGLSVFSERFTMIGDDDDERGVELTGRTKAIEQLAKLRVGERDLVVVGIGDALFRRAIRGVGVEQVDPAEPGRSWSVVGGRWSVVGGPWSLVVWRRRRTDPV